MHLLFQNLEKYISLSEGEKEVVASCLRKRELRKKEVYLTSGEVCCDSVFVVAGCLYGYTTDEKGASHVLQFAPEGWWIADMYSLISRKPGQMNIEALENSEVYLLSREDQESLFGKIPQLERFFRIITENSLVANQQRLIDNLSLTAEQRYQNFCQRYPVLKGKVPHKLVASYIGVTPEFFSKMLGKLSGK